MVKNWYLSKTIWLNLIGGICVALAAILPGANSVQQWLVDNAALLGGAWSVLGVILRLISKDKVVLVDK